MPRDAGGNYTLPAGNPVITGTVITSTWANPTMADVGNEITNSLSRDGQGGMRVPLEFFDGSTNAPGITFVLEPTAGMYRVASGIIGISAQGADIALFKGPTGNVEVAAAEPIEANDLSQKGWVEALVATAVAAAVAAQNEANWPVGSKFIGPDPNSVKPGTWVQLPEGTFLMNTVAGADPAGGSNDAVAIAHNHTASQVAHDHAVNDPGHNHGASSAEDNGNFGPRFTYNSRSEETINNVNSNTTGISLGNATPAITVVAAGAVGTNLNKPLYRGVEVWERTV